MSGTRTIALPALALAAVLAVAGCTQAAQTGSSTATAWEIVAKTPIDENGGEVSLTPDLAVKTGAQLAVDQHNGANPTCQVELKAFDTEGDPQKATAVAARIVDDPSIIGLVGPTWSGETKATGSAFDQAGLVAITPSATNVALSEQGWTTFFRGLSSDGVQGPSLANYLKNARGVKKVCVVDDSTDAGVGQAQAVRQTLGPITDGACNISIKKGNKDFSAAVTQIQGQSPDAVVYAAYDAATVLLKGIDSGAVTRPELRGVVAGYDGLGVARRYEWTGTGELISNLIWIYQVQ